MGLGAFQKSHTLESGHSWNHTHWRLYTVEITQNGVRLASMSTVLESKKLVCGKSWGQTDLHVDTSGVTHTRRWTLPSHPDRFEDIHRITHTGLWTSKGSDSLGCRCPWVVDAHEVAQIGVWGLLGSFRLGCGPFWAQTT